METRVARRCPSFLEIALWEAGDLADVAGASIRSHAGRCPRCGSTLCEIQVSRTELLGFSPLDQARAARRSADGLRQRLDCQPRPAMRSAAKR
jgi:hypothetical protein